MTTSRRDFFTRFLPQPAPPEATVERVQLSDYIEVSRHAMAGEFQIYFNAGEYREGVDWGLEALDEVTRLEKCLSYFDEESEIARLNRKGTIDFYSVGSEVYGLLRQCAALYRETEGALDITSTPLSEAWGFLRRRGQVPDEATLQRARVNTGCDRIAWRDEAYSLRLQPGMAVSLGSIGKGYALDRAAEILTAYGAEHFLFHGGSSSILARGECRGREDWRVGLHHPLCPGERLMEISLRNQALGTSGSAAQFFWYQGKRYGHVLDPRTGFPAEGVLSVTVLAPTAAEADALATAFYVMGVERTRAFCEKRTELSGVFVLPKSAGRDVELLRFGTW